MDESGMGVGGMERMSEEKMKASFQNAEERAGRNIGTLFEKISGKSNVSQLNKLTRFIPSNVPKFKRNGNEEQFQYNTKVLKILIEAEELCDNSPAEAKDRIAEAKDMLAHRQKLVDSSKHGWKLVSEYETDPLADDSDDVRRMYEAEGRVSRKLKAEHAKNNR